MGTLIETVQRFRKLEEATTAKDEPAPVYLLDEIADMARQSPDSAQAIADAVQKKLGVKSPVVKFKALRIIKHLCVKGCSQFQRCMQRHSSSVRELIHFRGDPDPFKGDVPNARVREFAKEVTEVLFNSTPVTNTSNTLAAQGKIQGFGSAGSIPADSSSTYGGIGSSASGSYSGGFRTGSGALPTSFAAAQQAASQLTHAAQQALGEGPIAQGIASAASALGGLLGPAGYGNRLNDSGYQDGNGDGFGYQNTGSSYSAPAVSHVTASQVLGTEEGIVDDICAAGGVRPLPDAADLRRFVDTASNMDGLRIAEVLREKLAAPRWQVGLRALAALEAVLQRGSNQACGEIAVMFQSDPEPIRACLKSPQQQVQARAASVLKLLLGEDVAVPTPSSSTSSSKAAVKAAAAAPAVDLLSLDDGPSQPVAAAPASAAAGIDLLGDLTGPTSAAAEVPAAAAAQVDSLFDGLGVSGAAAPSIAATAAHPAAAAAANSDDMFGGLMVAAPAASNAAAVGSKPAAPLDDFLSGLTVNSSNSSGAANSTPPLLVVSPTKPQQQQQQHNLLGPSSVKSQPAVNLLGDFGLSSPVQQQQQQPSFNMQQQVHMQQQQFGMPGLSVPLQQQQQPLQQQWNTLGSTGSGVPPFIGNLAQQQPLGALHGLQGHPGSGSGPGSSAWTGHDDVSNLLRQVGHGGKYDPAFDFVADEFKKL